MRSFWTLSPRIAALACGSLLFFFFVATGQAQQYHWRRAYFPKNNTDSWTSIAFNPLSHGRIIFVGPDFVGGVFRSDDGGLTWTSYDSLLDPSGIALSYIHQIFVLPSDTNIVFAISPEDFYRSTNGGRTWNDLFNHDTLGGNYFNFGGIGAECLAYNAREDALYYGQDVAGVVWRSTDHGANWTAEDTAHIDSIQVYSMDASQDVPPELIQSSQIPQSNLGYSTDFGASWNLTFFGTEFVETPKIVYSWYAMNPATGKHDVAIVQRWPTNDSSLVATTDGGRTWKILNAPARLWGLDIDQRASMLSKPGDPAYPLPLHIFTGLFDVRQDTIPNGMVQETTDGGISWHSINFPKGIIGDTANPFVREIWVLKYDTSTGRIIVAADSGVYIGDTVPSVAPPLDTSIHYSESENLITISSAFLIEAFRIYDVLGRELFETSPMRSTYSMDIAQYPRGTYAIEADVQGKPRFRKVVQW